MKKIVVVVSVMLLMLVGCSNSDEVLPFKSAAQVNDMLDNNATVVVVIGQTTCGACIQYKPVLEELVTNYDFEMAYVELDKDKNDDVQQLVNDHLLEASATPTTYVFVDGERVAMVVGYMDYRQTKAFFEEHNVIE